MRHNCKDLGIGHFLGVNPDKKNVMNMVRNLVPFSSNEMLLLGSVYQTVLGY